MQQFLIPSSTGSSQIINIPVSLLSQSNQQPISFITANGQIFQIPSISQLVVHQNGDGTSTAGNSGGVQQAQQQQQQQQNAQQQQQQSQGTASSSSTPSTTGSGQQTALVINHQGQLLSLPVLQAAASAASANTANTNAQQQAAAAAQFQAATSQTTSAQNTQANNNQLLQAVNLSQIQFLTQQNTQQQQTVTQQRAQSTTVSTVQQTNNSNNNSNNNQAQNGTTPIKTLLEEDDKSDTSIDDQGPTIANMPSSMGSSSNQTTQITHATTVDGVNLDEIREFAKAFKLRRLALGLTQTQVGQALSATKGPAYSQSAICRFEKLDITPKSAAKIKPVLEKWMQEAELKYADRLKSGSHQNFADLLGTENTKKRKRRTSFTPQALEILNDYFEKNTHPSGNQGADMTMLAQKLNYDREVIRVWFCNKRQALKNTLKKMKQGDGLETGSDASLSPNSSSNSISQTLNSQLIQTAAQQQQQAQVQAQTQQVVIVNTSNGQTQVLDQAHLQELTSTLQQQAAVVQANQSTPSGTPTKTVITLTNTKLEPQQPSQQQQQQQSSVVDSVSTNNSNTQNSNTTNVDETSVVVSTSVEATSVVDANSS